MGVIDLHEADPAVRRSELVLHAALQTQLLDFERLRLPGDFVWQQVPAKIVRKGCHRRYTQRRRRAEPAARRSVGADHDPHPALDAGPLYGRLEEIQDAVVLDLANVPDLS